MEPQFTAEEQELIEYAKKAIVKYNKIRHDKGGIDTLYAFLMSDSGQIYDGACFEPNLSHASFCGERHAIANMVLGESYKAKIKSISVILMQYIQGKSGWTFPKMERFKISELYPHPFEPKEGLWDNWEPK